MKLNARLEDISDGKLYEINDLVKVDTRGCDGCSACCHGMGDTIVLNPYDMYKIVSQTNMSYETLLDGKIELHTEEKITLPNIKMIGESEACGFLNGDERCSIHGARPNICRLFPLGRYYEEDNFKYIFKEGDCIKPNLSKVKVKNWINIANYNDNRKFILAWYTFLKGVKWRVKFMHNENELEAVNAYIIDLFYKNQWHIEEEFYEAIYTKMAVAKEKIGIL